MSISSRGRWTSLSTTMVAWSHPDAFQRLREQDTVGFYVDGSEWLVLLRSQLRVELDETVGSLANALCQTRLRTFHGCRTEDVGEYFRNGFRVHRRES
jgi:hypothetical protein